MSGLSPTDNSTAGIPLYRHGHPPHRQASPIQRHGNPPYHQGNPPIRLVHPPTRQSLIQRWRLRLNLISKPDNIGSGVKKKTKRRITVSMLAHFYWYKMKNLMTRILDKYLPIGTRIPGIRWAPRDIPLSRRLETFSVFLCILCSAILPTFSYGILYYLLYSPLWWLGLIYTFYLLNDHDVASHGGRRWEAYRNLALHRYIAKYFPINLVKTAELDPSKNYIAPTCPHGQIMIGPNTCFLSNAKDFSGTFPGIKSYLGMVPGRFKAPFLRELNLFAGGVTVSEESITYLMDKKHQGNFLCINLGGSAESMESRHNEYRVIVKNRKGYARIALKTGASIVPVFCFGETRAFNTDPYPEGSWMRDVQDKLRSLTGIAPIALRGRGFFQYNFGIIPYRTPIHVVVGAPIQVKQNYEPTQQDIDAVHNKYLEKLVELYEAHKHTYERDPTVKLVLM